MTVENAKERLFCPKCGGADVYDATGERDYICPSCWRRTEGVFVSPLRERDLQGQELIRLQLENERLKEIIRQLQASPETSK